MKRRISEVFLIVFLLAIFVNIAYAAEEVSLAKEIWDTIIWIFSLGWITESTSPFNTFVAFARLVLAIVTWVLTYELLKHAFGATTGKNALLSDRASMVISISIAIMVAVFFPTSLLLTIVTLYGAFVAFVMVAVPVGLAVWLAFSIPAEGKGQATSLWIRIVLFIVAMWLLRIIARWARFTVTAGGTQEFLTHATEIPAEQTASFLVTIAGTLSTLTTMADFGTFILVLAIIYNIGALMGAGDTATSHGGEFFKSIGEAFGKRAKSWAEEKAKGIEFPELKKRVEPALNEVIMFLKHLETELENVLTATPRPANIPKAVDAIINKLNKPLTTLRDISAIDGYDTVIDATKLSSHLQKSYASAITGTPANATGHEAFGLVYAGLAGDLESNLLTEADATKTPTDRRRYAAGLKTKVANCIYIVNALLANNKLHYR